MLMKTILLIVTVFPFLFFAQDVELRHYQRKHVFEKLPLPAQRFETSKFNIMFADSLFDVAKVQIKKAKFEAHKSRFNVLLEARNGVYQQVMLVCKGQQKLSRVVQMIHEVFPNADIPNDLGTHCLMSGQDQIHLEIRKVESRFVVVLKLEVCL